MSVRNTEFFKVNCLSTGINVETMNFLGYGKRWALHLWLRLFARLAPR